jgi:hypothetical protein
MVPAKRENSLAAISKEIIKTEGNTTLLLMSILTVHLVIFRGSTTLPFQGIITMIKVIFRDSTTLPFQGITTVHKVIPRISKLRTKVAAGGVVNLLIREDTLKEKGGVYTGRNPLQKLQGPIHLNHVSIKYLVRLFMLLKS